MTTHTIERRRHQRFSLPPMYTYVVVRTLDQSDLLLEGHAYDLSEGGLRFDLDQPIPPGTPVSISLLLPRDPSTPRSHNESERIIFAYGTVAWTLIDPDEPGPIPMAAQFTRFARPEDADALRQHLASGRYARAA